MTDYAQDGEITYFADQLDVYSLKVDSNGQFIQKKAPQTGIKDKIINAVAVWNEYLYVATRNGVHRLSLKDKDKDWE